VARRASKQPSPETNPAIQCLTSGVFDSKVALGTWGLGTGVILGEAASNLSGKPLFIEALILISLRRPASVRCSLLFTRSKALLNNKKSAYFLVEVSHSLEWPRRFAERSRF
jgi:hypothetical protein